MDESVKFFLNGNLVTIEKPAVDLLLIDYLRSPEVHLSGPKKPCGQGGCGGCTVIVSQWDEHGDGGQGAADHAAINSCLRPVVALNGLVVTTIEGTGAYRTPNPKYPASQTVASRGAAPATEPAPPALLVARAETQAKRTAVLDSVATAVAAAETTTGHPALRLNSDIAQFPSEMTRAGVNPVAHRLAINNGSQCGYCTVGFVMNMSEFLHNNPHPTKREVEEIFDGNICRCTGYRPILTGMKTFAANWSPQDEDSRMVCLGDAAFESQKPAADVEIPFPDAAKVPAQAISLEDAQHRRWLTPTSLAQLTNMLRQYRDEAPYLVHANTSYGIYPREFLQARVLIDLNFVPELQSSQASAHELLVGAGTTYSAFIKLLKQTLANQPAARLTTPDPENTALGAVLFMARRTAGRLVRNAATLGGNVMLVLKHMAASPEAPFPSDVSTALVAIGAKVQYLDPAAEKSAPVWAPLAELLGRVEKTPDLANRVVLLAFKLPYGAEDEVVLAQKVALRDVNAHSIVNAATRLTLQPDLTVRDAHLVFGGLAPYPWRALATEKALRGQPLTLDRVPALLQVLLTEIDQHLPAWHQRLALVPDEGFTDEYRKALATALLYKAVVNALAARGAALPPAVRSSGEITWGRWPVSTGTQDYKVQDFKRPVSQPYIKFTALQQASGQIHYTQELAVPPGTVQAALVQSRRAYNSFYFCLPHTDAPADLSDLRAYLAAQFPGAFIDLITSSAFKDGRVNLQGMGYDQPMLAENQVNYVGQALALVGARTEQQAIAIAEYVADTCVAYGEVTVPAGSPPWWSKPVLTLKDAVKCGSIFPDRPGSASYMNHVWRITRPGSQLGWVAEMTPFEQPDDLQPRTAVVDGNLCSVVTAGQQVGGQAHFYMETQAVVAEPADDGRMIIHSSTQSPLAMHNTAVLALNAQYNSVDVRVTSVGGGFGGKTEQTRFVVGPAAVAAQAMKRPVRLALSREQDTALIGKRHAYYGQYQIAIDTGAADESRRGILRGLVNNMWGDGGAFYDCSFIVSNCIMARADNAYLIANFQAQIDVARTNTAPSTAFRAFGDIQGKLILENAIDDAACSIGMTAEAVREKNLYHQGDVTPFGQALSYCYMRDVWKYLKQECQYDFKLAEVKAFNEANRWRKRGLSMIPVKYGSGYNLTMLEQAAVLVAVYQGDGSVIIHQGGVEMGQGLLTQVRQVASYILNIPMTLIRVEGPATSVIPNPTSTGASTGTSYSAEAVKRTCEELRARLMAFGYQMLTENGNDWCRNQKIDFWNYGEQGWRAQPANAPSSPDKPALMIWQNLIALAYQKRVGLVCSLTVPMHGGETPVPNVTYKPGDAQPQIPGYTSAAENKPSDFDSFPGFTYSAACSVVEVDILTGEVKIISSDLVYDVGWSLNPALDIGQVEGAFVQGIGYVLSEKLVFEPEGKAAGRLNTVNTWTYKPPATTSIPLEFNVRLFPRDLAGAIPDNPSEVLSSKEVGEPPLVLAATVFFAVKAAIRASRTERGLNPLFRFDAPATVQEVRRASEVALSHYNA
jgi:xanthine dehydrogenase/oxidase